MPLIPKFGDQHLKFDVAAPPDWSFVAGNIIIGNVVRHAPIISPDVKVSLALVGRSRINPEVTEGYSHTCYLIYQEQDVLFQGPLHHPEGSDTPLSWPFSIQIPSEPDQSLIQQHSQSTCHLPLNEPEHPGHHAFPGSFYSSHKQLGDYTEGIIEYYLRARLECIFGGSKKTMDATWPIIMRHVADETYDLDTLKQISALRCVRSWTLAPGTKDLSLKQRLHFDTPEYYFRVKLSYPEAVQLDNPRVMPVTLEVIPEQGTSKLISGILPTIRVNCISMILRSHCHLARRRKASGISLEAKNETHEWRYDLGLDRLFKALDRPITLSTKEEGYKPLRIGQMFQLVFRSNGLASGKRLLSNPTTGIHPDFVSYDIKHYNVVQWKISLNVGGENHEVKGSVPMKLIGAA